MQVKLSNKALGSREITVNLRPKDIEVLEAVRIRTEGQIRFYLERELKKSFEEKGKDKETVAESFLRNLEFTAENIAAEECCYQILDNRLGYDDADRLNRLLTSQFITVHYHLREQGVL